MSNLSAVDKDNIGSSEGIPVSDIKVNEDEELYWLDSSVELGRLALLEKKTINW